MIKYGILLINLLGVMLFNLFVDPIKITQKIPQGIKAGEEFLIEITIEKGDLSGFSMLEQQLPEGFTAESVESNDANFTFTNQTVKHIWTSLPSDEKFTISYKIKIKEDSKGVNIIGGTLSYVINNERQTTDVDPVTIDLGGISTNAVTTSNSDTTNKSTQTSAKNTNDTITVKDEIENLLVSVTRNLPTEATKEFKVEVQIYKDGISGFAKFVETLPNGFTATAIKTNNAQFTFIDQKVRFVWATLPNDETLKVAYNVKVNKNISGAQTITGDFSYLANNESKEYKVSPSVINITETVSNNVSQNTTNTNNENNTSASTQIPEPEKGVAYRVQLAALKKQRKPSYFTNRYKISGKIYVEQIEGLSKYTTGKITEYRSARDFREEIKEKGVVGAFVTAYNNGTRITVQEALMISSQKWIK